MPSNDTTPTGGMVISVIISLSSLAILSSFLTQKYAAVKKWRMLPCAMWLVVAIYLDSFLFVFCTAILKYGLGLDSSYPVCDGAILLCLVAYVSTKLIYLFLVEKAYLIRDGLVPVPRMKSKLWLFNIFGMMSSYCVVIVLNFVYRIARIDDKGQCVIGMERRALLPLIIFDLIVNVYLTCLFMIPLLGLYSFKNKGLKGPVTRLQKMARRTFVGSICTLTSSIVNLSVLTALNGEPGWVCLLCCNSDVLFSAVMVYWVTFNDHVGTHRSQCASGGEGNFTGGSLQVAPGHDEAFDPCYDDCNPMPPAPLFHLSEILHDSGQEKGSTRNNEKIRSIKLHTSGSSSKTSAGSSKAGDAVV